MKRPIRNEQAWSRRWLKEYRRIATRYEKLAVSFMAMLKLALIRFYLKKHSSDTA